MPPAILSDSEDEDGDVVFDDGDNGCLSRSSGDQVASIDGTRDSTEQSTGSTGMICDLPCGSTGRPLTLTARIQRQMEEVQRSLFADFGEHEHVFSPVSPPARTV